MFLMSLPVRPVYRVYRWIWQSIDWLYPPRCGGCGERGERWCENCQRSTHIISPPVCCRCGRPVKSGIECVSCKKAPHRYDALRSYAEFDGSLRNALHRLKYRRDLALGECLSIHLVRLFDDLNWTVEIITPVPLGIARLAERGYNQSALIARPLALACGIDYVPDALQRSKETQSQVGLNALQRKENVAHAFIANPALVSKRNILVIDDVATSGATLDACSAALLESGANRVYCMTLARAL
jgi:competence protein ComFC